MKIMTNRLFAENDAGFKKACQMTGDTLFPGNKNKDNLEKAYRFATKIQTTRQASKFKRGTGVVYKTITGKS